MYSCVSWFDFFGDKGREWGYLGKGQRNILCFIENIGNMVAMVWHESAGVDQLSVCPYSVLDSYQPSFNIHYCEMVLGSSHLDH